MAINFDEDPCGAILEYCYLMKDANGQMKQTQKEWEEENFQIEQGMFAHSMQHFWNGLVDINVLIHQLSRDRDKKTVKRQLRRIFNILENKSLIEPDVEDDNPHSILKQITELGEELYATGSYLEFINGPKYIFDKWSPSVAKIYSKNSSEYWYWIFVLKNSNCHCKTRC